MVHQPDIYVASLDLIRLEGLLNTFRNKRSPVRLSLEDELGRAKIVDSFQLPDDVVSMNSTVELRVTKSDFPVYMTLVYPYGMRKDGSTLSILSPIGTALLGIRQGEEFYWPGRDGRNIKARLENILYQPEREGHYNL